MMSNPIPPRDFLTQWCKPDLRGQDTAFATVTSYRPDRHERRRARASHETNGNARGVLMPADDVRLFLLRPGDARNLVRRRIDAGPLMLDDRGATSIQVLMHDDATRAGGRSPGCVPRLRYEGQIRRLACAP